MLGRSGKTNRNSRDIEFSVIYGRIQLRRGFVESLDFKKKIDNDKLFMQTEARKRQIVQLMSVVFQKKIFLYSR